jgi:biotin carboxyl carrier protein
MYYLRIALITILLGTGAATAVSSVKYPSNSIDNPTAILSPSNQPKRLKITLSINDPQDLKVREGDRVAKGQILSDRDLERRRLNRKRTEILLSINKIEKSPLPIIKQAPEIQELPRTSFAIAETEIQQAELKFSQAQRNLQNALSYDPFITAKANIDKARAGIEQAARDFNLQQRKLDAVNGLKGLPPEMLDHETEKLRQKQNDQEAAQAQYDFYQAEYRQIEAQRQQAIADLQNKMQLAGAELEVAQARLRSDKEQRERTEYEHRITLARRAEESNQMAIAAANQKLDREFKLAQLQEQLSATEEKLNGISQVRSPYSGIIKRIKTERQADNTITVNVTLSTESNLSVTPENSN